LLAAILERRPDDVDCRRLLADVCLDRNDLPAAEAHLRKLLEQDHDDAQSHHSLGLLLEESGRAAEAVRHFDRALALDPQNEVYILSREASQQQ
jgi:Flp pilus assembly protein TadD